MHKAKYQKKSDEKLVLACKIDGEPVLVKAKEIKSYVEDPLFGYMMGVYNYTKLWGMPNGNGWANEPCEILEGITAIELEAKAMEHEELEDAKNKK